MVSDEHTSPLGEATPQATAAEPAPPPAAEAPKEGKPVASKTKRTAKKASKKAAKAKNGTAKVSTAKRDQFGLRDGSKASQAAAMFNRASGAKMAAVKEKTGGTVYNLLNKLKENGHKVSQDEDGTYHLKAK